MNNKERVDLIEKIKQEIDNGYHNRDDYPPYAIMSWDDRSRYRAYVFKTIYHQRRLNREQGRPGYKNKR
jgi:hypothetical protein